MDEKMNNENKQLDQIEKYVNTFKLELESHRKKIKMTQNTNQIMFEAFKSRLNTTESHLKQELEKLHEQSGTNLSSCQLVDNFKIMKKTAACLDQKGEESIPILNQIPKVVDDVRVAFSELNANLAKLGVATVGKYSFSIYINICIYYLPTL